MFNTDTKVTLRGYMVYHVIIRRKKRDTYEQYIVELDLSEKEVKKRIVKPYNKKKSIFCNNMIIDYNNISSISITETEQDSSHIRPKIIAKRKTEKLEDKRKKRVAVNLAYSEDEEIARTGANATHKFFIEPKPHRKKVSFSLKKNIKWLAPIIATAYCTIVFYPLIGIPNVAPIGYYADKTKVFPDTIYFRHEQTTESYIAEFNLYISKIGGNPAILFMELSEPDGVILNREYGKTIFKKVSYSSQWVETQTTFKFELKEENPPENFTLYVAYGSKYYLYPFFGLHWWAVNIGDSYQAWCTYEKDQLHIYKWQDSSFSD